MEQLIAGKCPPSRQLDLIEAVKARRGEVPALAEKLAIFEAPRAAAEGTPAFFTECLEGGSAATGKVIVNEHLAANCMACHRFDSKEGSNVGPVLSTIGAQKDRAYLLASLVAPMAHITPGYGMVAVTLGNGKSLSGSLVSKDDKNVIVRLADGVETKIDPAEIVAMTEPVSVMPPMGAMLNKREIRDVVAYLSGLKGKTTVKTEVRSQPKTTAKSTSKSSAKSAGKASGKTTGKSSTKKKKK
jgi:putative heme-binding domain-containing protein